MLSTDNFGHNVTFVDDFTRITWFHPLCNNSYFFATFYQFEKLISKQFSNKQKCVKIDRGGEFLKMKFKDYCSVNGIIHQVSCPYTHAQKGLVERRRRSIHETGLAQLFHTKLPYRFWV